MALSSGIVLDPPPSAWRAPGLPLQPTALPPLPSIRSPTLRQRIFTHSSFFPLSNGNSSTLAADYYEREAQSYQREEFVGDGGLSQHASRALAQRYPSLSSGCLSQLKEKLVRNDTLAYLAWAYGFSPRIRCAPTNFAPGSHRLPFHQQQDILADVFEAYLGALMMEAEPQEWLAWLDGVFSTAVFPGLAAAAEELKTIALRNLEARHSRKRKTPPSDPEEDVTPGPSTLALGTRTDDRLTWTDIFSQRNGSHSTMLYNGIALAEGRGTKQAEARWAAVAAYVRQHLEEGEGQAGSDSAGVAEQGAGSS